MQQTKLNLYSISGHQPVVRVHVLLENQDTIETYLFSTKDTYYVDSFIQWLHDNINISAEELDIVLYGFDNTIYSLYFELRKTHPKVRLAEGLISRLDNFAA